MSGPRVFDPGSLTLTVAPGEATVSVGHLSVKAEYVKSFAVFYDAEAKTVKAIVEFYKSHHAETALLIEEAMRTVRTLGWVEVRS